MLGPMASRFGIALRAPIEPGWQVWSDRERLKQVLNNLGHATMSGSDVPRPTPDDAVTPTQFGEPLNSVAEGDVVRTGRPFNGHVRVTTADGKTGWLHMFDLQGSAPSASAASVSISTRAASPASFSHNPPLPSGAVPRASASA